MKPSKAAYWEKWRFFDLINDLKEVELLLEEKYGNKEYDNTFEGNVHAELIFAIEEIEYMNRNDLFKIESLFVKSDNILKILGSDQKLINRIKEITTNWKNNS